MPRVAWLFLVLTILVVGAGIFVLTGYSWVTSASASISHPSVDTNTTTLTNSSTTQDSVQLAPASDTMYGSDAESEISSTSVKTNGHYCDGEKSSGY